jgi:hypothetical protein
VGLLVAPCRVARCEPANFWHVGGGTLAPPPPPQCPQGPPSVRMCRGALECVGREGMVEQSCSWSTTWACRWGKASWLSIAPCLSRPHFAWAGGVRCGLRSRSAQGLARKRYFRGNVLHSVRACALACVYVGGGGASVCCLRRAERGTSGGHGCQQAVHPPQHSPGGESAQRLVSRAPYCLHVTDGVCGSTTGLTHLPSFGRVVCTCACGRTAPEGRCASHAHFSAFPLPTHVHVCPRGQPVPTSLLDVLTSPLMVGVPGGVIKDVFASRRRGTAADTDESILAFFSRRFSGDVARRLVDPLISGIYAGDISRLSIQSVFPSLVRLEREHGSVVVGAAVEALHGWLGRSHVRSQPGADASASLSAASGARTAATPVSAVVAGQGAASVSFSHGMARFPQAMLQAAQVR